MASPDISLLGAVYNSVSGVSLPKQGGGTATFPWVEGSETKTANGTYDVTNLAELVVNVSGGGGSGIGTLLNTTALGTISTSSTTAADTGVDVVVKGINGYDLLIVETSVDTKVVSRHAATTRLIFLLNSTTIGTVTSATLATVVWNCKMSNVLTNATTRSNTTARGIYPYDCTISTSDNGTATMNMYRCYNSTQTGTINGSYTTRVYGVKLYDLLS